MAYWLSSIITVLVVYIAISTALYYLQDYMLFKPEKLPIDFQFDYENQETKEYNLETRDGATINGLRFFPKGESKGVVLYLKGNSKSIKGWGKFAVDFTRHGYNVLMVDYRGFGKSTGRRSQKAIKRDLQLVYNKLKEQTTEDRIILYGRSLGSGFAAKLASMNHPKMLVLDAPYYSLTKVTARYAPFMPLSLLLKYPLPTYKWLKYVQFILFTGHMIN
jgi:alpha-beta hydrolase superfamily lysophospholipase